jgi:hypothetical protein
MNTSDSGGPCCFAWWAVGKTAATAFKVLMAGATGGRKTSHIVKNFVNGDKLFLIIGQKLLTLEK